MNWLSHHIAFHRPVRYGRIFFAMSALWFGLLPASAQQKTFDLNLASGDFIHATPGTLVTLPVRISSYGENDIEVRTSILLPSGWRLVTPIPTTTLSRRGTDLLLVIVGIPREEASRVFSVRLTAVPNGDTSASQVAQVTVVVRKVRQLEVRLIDAPRYNIAGDRIPFTYEVVNKGNDTALVVCSARSSRDFTVTLDRPSFSIPPGQSRRVIAGISTTSENSSTIQHTLEFEAKESDGEARTSMSTVTDIVPRASSVEPRRVELPVFARLRLANERGVMSYQGEISAFGSMREDGRDRLEVLLRAPETQTLSVLGRRDEYRIRYRHGPHEVYAGDMNYALTTLTEIGRYAFGAGGITSVGNATLGGFTNTTRLGAPNQKETAGFVRYDFSPDEQAGVNVLHRSDRGTADIVTINGMTSLFAGSQLEGEIGRSAGSAGNDMAIAARLKGRLPWLTYDVRMVDAGAQYGGYYRDVRFSSMSLAAYADRDVRVEFSGRNERRNLNADTLIGTAPKSDFVQIGVGYSNYVAVYLRGTNLADPISASPYDRHENVVQVRASYPFAFATVSAYADIGALRDRSIGVDVPSRRYAAAINAQPFTRQSYSLSSEITRTRDLASGGMQERISTSLLASYVLGERTQAGFSVFSSHASGVLSQTYSLFDASVDHVFPFNHRLQFHVRRSSLSGAPVQTSAALDYGIPLAVPLGRVSATGTLTGRLLDAVGSGIAGVLVSLGATGAVTDDHGYFVFVDLAPGPYFLSIDRSTMGLQHITTVPLPMEVRVIGAEETKLELRVIKGAMLRGSLRVFDLDESGGQATGHLVERESKGDASVVAELSNGLEVLRRTSDSRGRFEFTDLRPGRWTLIIEERTLPAEHYIEPRREEIEITEGGSHTTEVRVLPRRKVIRIIQEGGVLGVDSPSRVREEFFGAFIIRHDSARGAYMVQLSAWKFEAKAQEDLRRVRGLTSKNSRIEPVDLPTDGRYYRVLVGPFATSDEAKTFCRLMER